MPEDEVEKQALSEEKTAPKTTTPASFKWILWVILFVLGVLVAYFLWELFS
jgi:tryptophan-rich sensory protein